MFLNFSVGLYWYKSASAEMSKDWDFTDKPRIERYKGFQQWRHDNNGRAINWPHTLAGMTYYQVARSNNFSAYESLMWTIASSSAWEYIVEYREVVSINDQVFTGIAGAFFGEVLYQFSVALRSADNSILSKTLSYLFNGAGAINMFLDRYKTIIDRRSDLPDHLKEFKIGVFAQQYLQDNAKKYAPGIILKGKIINIAEYVTDGKDSGWAKGTILSELDMHGAFANMDMTDVEIAVKLAFEGYYRKNIKERNMIEHVHACPRWVILLTDDLHTHTKHPTRKLTPRSHDSRIILTIVKNQILNNHHGRITTQNEGIQNQRKYRTRVRQQSEHKTP
jgi:hypothetical protein